MQKKLVFLVSALLGLIFVNQAFAQSSHDALNIADPDLKDTTSSQFEIASPGGKFRLGFRGHLQENNRYSYTDGAAAGAGAHGIDLELNRARLSLFGSALDPRLSFLIQIGADNVRSAPLDAGARGVGRSDTVRFFDYYVNHAFHDHVHLRLGKFRTPFSRQLMMSTSQLQFIDPSPITEGATKFQVGEGGRDVGLMVHNGFRGQIEWALAAVSRGVVGRLGYNHGPLDGYDAVDWSGGPLRFGVAGSGYVRTDYKSVGFSDIRASFDFIAKIRHFSTNGAFTYGWEKLAGAGEGIHNIAAGVDAGYLLVDHKIEPVIRYAFTKTPLQGHNVVLGANYYMHGHHLKLQPYFGLNFGEAFKFTNLNTGLQIQLAI